MSRIMLLLIIVIWMMRSALPSLHGPADLIQGVGLFTGGLLLLVLFMGLWSRVIARHVRHANLHSSLRRFHGSLTIARWLIPTWFAVAVYWLGWGEAVDSFLQPIRFLPIELPGLLLGTAPAFLAWMALWWAQFPADRALREQTILHRFDDDLPIHAPPPFWSYFTSNLRLQVLFTIVPVASILLLRDLVTLGLWQFFSIDIRAAATDSSESGWETTALMSAIGLVVLFMPELLRHVLSTQRLPDSPLRQRLEALCKSTGLRYRDILLWKTNFNMGNAAVMGIIPQVRYVLLSDMLLETMTDEQIEAVFAHELGHIKHRHMIWYTVLFATLLLLLAGPGEFLGERLDHLRHPAWLNPDLLSGAGVIAGIGGFFLVFGFLSRWFERQADVYAARLMQRDALAGSHVGPYGASTFASALRRVAIVNNIPMSARNFTHGSIADRVHYLQTLSGDPQRTVQFDRWMALLNALQMFVLVVCGVWIILTQAL